MSREKKRKRDPADRSPFSANSNEVDTSKPTAVFEPTKRRAHTLSVALPGSIVANAKSHEQKTYLAGTIARALAVFCVDEVVIFDDDNSSHSNDDTSPSQEGSYTAFSDPCHFLAHLLSYLETPPHLRKALFPMHPNLRTAGTLPSLDMPHHLRANEYCPYREGVTMKSAKNGTYVDVGLANHRLVPDVQIPPHTRVTIQIDDDAHTDAGLAVAPSAPREDAGYYWGYTVRRSLSLSGVFTECPFDGGYDVSFGTSERGASLSQTLANQYPSYKHLLVVFGGVAGLETAARNDAELSSKGLSGANVSELFDYWVNVLPGQGSRTIRTEEAVWLGLMGLRRIVEGNTG